MEHDALICKGCLGRGRLAPKSVSADTLSIETVNLLQIIAQMCNQLGMENKVTAVSFNLVVIQYQGSFHIPTEVRKAIVWSKDQNKRIITTSFLMNWFSIAHSKAQKVRREQKFKEKDSMPNGRQALSADRHGFDPRGAIPAVPISNLSITDLHKEQKEKVERDPRLQEFLKDTAEKKSMSEPSYEEVKAANDPILIPW